MATSRTLLNSRTFRGVVVGLIAAAVGVTLQLSGLLQGAENTTWDARVRALAAPTSATDDILLVMVEQADLDAMLDVNGIGWPWPRSLYGFMVDFAAAAGAESFTFDLILEDEGVGSFTDDQFLRDAAGAFGRVVYGAQFFQGSEEPWPDHISRPDFAVSGDQILNASDEELLFQQASFPYEYVIPPTAVLTFVNQQNDDDGVFRRYRLHNYYLEQPMPALALGGVLAGARSTTLVYERGGVLLDDLRIPIDRDGKVLLRYTTPEPPAENGEQGGPRHQQISAFELAVSGFLLANGETPILEPQELAGKHLVLGLAASGLQDLRPTPLDPRAPGVTVHATMLDNLLSGEFMRDLPGGLSILLIVVLGLAAAVAATLARRTIVELALFVLLAAVVIGLGILGYTWGFWVPMVNPLIAVFLAVAAANVANYATEGAEKRFIRGAFAQYLSPDVVNQVVDDPKQLRLGGVKRELTMFFSDIQGFTTISEALEPEQLSGFLQNYLSALVRIIQDEGGTIDKFEGDAIIAFWNAPLSYDDHPLRGVRAALSCQQVLSELRSGWLAPPPDGVGVPIYTRIGINTGEVSVGNFGSESRFDYTALGDHMNLAARLEGSNKLFGTFLLISEFTQKRIAGEFPTRELGRIGVVGRSKPLTVFEPMLAQDFQQRRASLEVYGLGLQAFYEGRFAEAAEQWQSIAAEDPPAAQLLVQARQMAEMSDADLPSEWDGVVRLTSK